MRNLIVLISVLSSVLVFAGERPLIEQIDFAAYSHGGGRTPDVKKPKQTVPWQGNQYFKWRVYLGATSKRLQINYTPGLSKPLIVTYHYDSAGRLTGKVLSNQRAFGANWNETEEPIPAPAQSDKSEAALAFHNAVPLTMEMIVPQATDRLNPLRQIRNHFAEAQGGVEHYLLLRKVAGLLHYRLAVAEELLENLGQDFSAEALTEIADDFVKLEDGLREKLKLPTHSGCGEPEACQQIAFQLDRPADLSAATKILEAHLTERFKDNLDLIDAAMPRVFPPAETDRGAKAKLLEYARQLEEGNPDLAAQFKTMLTRGHFRLIPAIPGEEEASKKLSLAACQTGYRGEEPLPIVLEELLIRESDSSLQAILAAQFDATPIAWDRIVGNFLQQAPSKIPLPLFLLTHEVGHWWSIEGERGAAREENWYQRYAQTVSKELLGEMFLATYVLSKVPPDYPSRPDADPKIAEAMTTWPSSIVDSRGIQHILLDDRAVRALSPINQPPKQGLFSQWPEETKIDGKHSWYPASERLAHAFAIDQLAGLYFAGVTPATDAVTTETRGPGEVSSPGK